VGDEFAMLLDDVGGGAADRSETDNADSNLFFIHEFSVKGEQSQRLKA